MLKRMNALVWLRNQILVSNKNLLIQILMPYMLVFLYKSFMGDTAKGMDLMFVCLSTAISMSVGSMISVMIAEEKEKNNLKSMILSGVRYHEYILSVFIHPIIIIAVTMVSFPLITESKLGDLLVPYIVAIFFTATAVMLVNLIIGLYSSTQSKAQINSLPVLFIVSLLPMFSGIKTEVKDFIEYTFMGAYTNLFTTKGFTLSDKSVLVLFAWNAVLLILAFLAMRNSRKIGSSQKKGLKKVHFENLTFVKEG